MKSLVQTSKTHHAKRQNKTMRRQIIEETKHENEAETGVRSFMNQIHVFAT